MLVSLPSLPGLFTIITNDLLSDCLALSAVCLHLLIFCVYILYLHFSYGITLVFNPGKAALGHMMLLLTPINCDNLPGSCNTAAFYINPLHRSKIVPGSFPRLTIEKSKISHNGQGISALHYNR